MREPEACWLLVIAALASVMVHGAVIKPNVLVTINTFNRIRLTSDKFIGFSISPELVLTYNNYSTETLSLLQGLAPAYLRIGGNISDQLTFHPIGDGFGETTYNAYQWESLNKLAEETGLKMIFSLNTNENRDADSWARNNTEALLALSDKLGFNPLWQLGYEITAHNESTQISGKSVARNLANLQNLLVKFHRYKNADILGPDFRTNGNDETSKLMQDYIQEDDIAKILILRPSSKGQSEDEAFQSVSIPISTVNKLYLTMPSQPSKLRSLTRKEVWLGEDEVNACCSGEFPDALSWALRLGYAAKLGYQVVLKQMTQLQLLQPTPDYWVSLLYRNLVGQAVLDMRLLSGVASVTVFVHCTAYEERAAHTVLDSETEYQRGAVTVWGVNTAQESVRVTLLTSRQDQVHLYALTSREIHQGQLWLNNKVLSLNHGALPKLSPKILDTKSNMSVLVPARSVFFIVLPEAKAQACLNYPTDISTFATATRQQPEEEIQGDFIFEKGGVFESDEGTGISLSTYEQEKNRNIPELSLRKGNGNLRNYFKDDDSLPPKDSEEFSSYIDNNGHRNEHMKNNLMLPEIRLSNLRKFIPVRGSPNARIIFLKNLLNTKFTENRDTNIAEEYQQENSLSAENNKERLEMKRTKRSDEIKNNLQNIKINQNNQSLPRHRSLYFKLKNMPFLSRNNTIKPKDPATAVIQNQTNFSFNNAPEQKILDHLDKTKPNNEALFNINNIQEKNDFLSRLLENKMAPDMKYRPGEFYETLGGLKIDSNLSLADIEEQHDSFAAILKEQTQCGNGESKLTTVKKPVNTQKDDKIIVENATEDMKKYYSSLKDSEVESLCDEKKLNNEEIKCCSEKKPIENHLFDSNPLETHGKSPTINATSQLSLPVSNQKVNNFNDSKRKLFLNRRKRDVDGFKYVAQIFQSNNSTPQNSTNSTKTESARDSQLQVFLQELTEEGEELLKSFDQEKKINYNSQLKINNSTNDGKIVPARNYKIGDNLELKTNLINNRTFNQQKYFVKNYTDSSSNKTENTPSYKLKAVSVENIDQESPMPSSESLDFSPSLKAIKISKLSPSERLSLTPEKPESNIQQPNPLPLAMKNIFLTSKNSKSNYMPKIEKINVFNDNSQNESSTLKQAHELLVDKKVLTKPQSIKPTLQEIDRHLSTTESHKKIKEATSRETDLMSESILLSALAERTKGNDSTKNREIKEDISVFTTTETTPLLRSIISNRHKKRVEAFKAKLQRARERLQSLSRPRAITVSPMRKLLHPLPVNRDIDGKITMRNIGTLEKKKELHFLETIPHQYEPEAVQVPTKDVDTIQRTKRQISDQNLEIIKNNSQEIEKTDVEELSDEHVLHYSSIPDLLIQSKYKPIKKWIIPLSNHTEKILLLDKIFPVKLYGMLSEDWEKQSNNLPSRTQRERRSVRYSCMRDNFDYYDTEDEEVGNTTPRTLRSNVPDIEQQDRNVNNREHTKIAPFLLISPEDYSRKKRSIGNEIERNVRQMRDRLSNEIVKEQPGSRNNKGHLSSNDIFDSVPDKTEGAFSSLLQKTVAENMKNKTGIERMFELAKLYNKTNHDSLEVLSDGNTEKVNRKDKIDEENKALEVTDMEERKEPNLTGKAGTVIEKLTKLTGTQETTTVGRNNSDNNNNNGNPLVQENFTLKPNENATKDIDYSRGILSTMLHKILVFMKNLANFTKKP